MKGTALVLGTGPLDTSIWTTPSGSLCIVSVECAEPDVDEPKLLTGMEEKIFDDPLSTTAISFSSGQIVMFDSAEPGSAAEKRSISFELAPGSYRVLSQKFDPDAETSFIIHKFLPLG